MRGSELLEQMEQVDPAYVMDADAPPKKKKSWAWAAVAAVLCLVLGGWLIGDYLGAFRDTTIDPLGPMLRYSVGSENQSGYGTLIYHTHDQENCIVAFTLILLRDMKYSYASMKGYTYVPVEYEIIDGEKVVTESKVVDIHGRTPIDAEDYAKNKEVCDRLVVTVNGEPARYLPTKAGTYEVRIDYTQMDRECIYLYDSIHIFGFGTLWVDRGHYK